jgi:hypothetical protein
VPSAFGDTREFDPWCRRGPVEGPHRFEIAASTFPRSQDYSGNTIPRLIDLSIAATGATLAGGISKNLANCKILANSKQVANVKGDKVPPKQAAASVAVHQVWPQAPIVMGRSVSLHHKTKLHHVKVKSLDSNENSISADGSQ